MSTAAATLFVVGEDPEVRAVARQTARRLGLRCEEYAQTGQFLGAIPSDREGCLILELDPATKHAGLSLQAQLGAVGRGLPVIIVSGQANVAMAVEAVRCGALDVLEKPLDRRRLQLRIREALARDADSRRLRAEVRQIESRLRLLSPRERQVLELIVAGHTTKAIARQLGSSSHTVQNQRASILKKMQASCAADLVRKAMLCRAAGPT